MAEILTGVPEELDARLRHVCAELRDVGNSLEGVAEQLQTAPEHVNVRTLEAVGRQAIDAVEKVREYRRLLNALWERQG